MKKLHCVFLTIASFIMASSASASAYYVSLNGAYQADIRGNGDNQMVVVVDSATGKTLSKKEISMQALDWSHGIPLKNVKIQWSPDSKFFVVTGTQGGERVMRVISGSNNHPFEKITNLDASASPKLVDLVIGSGNDVIATVKDSSGNLSHIFWTVKPDGDLELTGAL
jgi:hypothetical protein